MMLDGQHTFDKLIEQIIHIRRTEASDIKQQYLQGDYRFYCWKPRNIWQRKSYMM